MGRVLTIACCLFVGSAASAAQVDAEPGLEGFGDKAPRCSKDIADCYGMVLHVVVKDGKPIQTPEWFAHQLAESNRHFAKNKINFELVEVHALSPKWETVTTRRQRDLLGRKRYTRKVIHCFLIGHLMNVDAEGEIRGVHWRDRAKRRHHWVVLASIAPDWVLAHEIGHFFGLPHSQYPISIMNKTLRDDPPPETRSFAKPERARMKTRNKRYKRTRELRTRR